MYDKNALVALIRERALTFGDFTLASGKKASFYLDCRQITLDSHGARLVAEGMFEQIEADLPDAVGGMSIGADPITGALLALAGLRGLPLRGIMVRKEPKGHGTGRYLEGPVAPGHRVVIVEDVVTTGGSSLLAIQRCEQFGLKVERVLTIVDRMEGGAATFRAQGYPFTSLLSVADLGIEPPRPAP
ncbi:MAG: orotate phosphoribosyltransferase [Planctomycetes bacterium RBG_16_64_10]|nr:MAG: orotate phosphoribosyltransferase [Planctomycetes bacterium RBG_16_64_10]